ncbi:MAG TPA: YraN family protein [Acidobacteriota bacterium]|nr:YraN family protein [Acidobacteriota bacterium]
MPNTGDKHDAQMNLPIGGPPRSRRSEPKPNDERTGRTRPGAAGERLAEKYLEQRGFQIVARNWRAPETRNEIDLIVQDRATLVFVEVKMARTRNFGDPATWIPPRKQRAIIKAAKAFLAAYRPPNPEFRFDAVLIAPPGPDGQPTLRHIEAAFTLDDSEIT